MYGVIKKGMRATFTTLQKSAFVMKDRGNTIATKKNHTRKKNSRTSVLALSKKQTTTRIEWIFEASSSMIISKTYSNFWGSRAGDHGREQRKIKSRLFDKTI